jgi:nickel superoxide dismutase
LLTIDEGETMKRLLVSITALTAVLLCSAKTFAHCEVPCGIYADQRRFEELLEDQATIAKAITSIGELAGANDALSNNQLVRWVTTKEAHATNSQHIIAQYFMTQRIKPGTEGYEKKLTAAHGVMVAAMKCKQAADPKTADALRGAILDLYRAYTGKEPKLD